MAPGLPLNPRSSTVPWWPQMGDKTGVRRDLGKNDRMHDAGAG